VACGTGNAALAAAALTGSVIGVDLAPRLIEVARQRAAASGLTADFRVADATALPLPDASADAVLSVFGVSFTPAAPTVTELARILAPGGCVALTVWEPWGAAHDAGRVLGEALARSAGVPVPPAQPWSDPIALPALLAEHGLVATVSEHALLQRGASVETWVAEMVDSHPLWRNAAARLTPADFDAARAAATAIVARANEDPPSFALTMDYRLIVARHTALGGRARPRDTPGA